MEPAEVPWHAGQDVPSGKLTRQELGWLLAQEARGAANSLRAEVTELRASLRPKKESSSAPDEESEERISVTQLPAEASLKVLDQAIGLLSDLEAGPKRGRRGRLDLASLLYELAPDCRISIEPGAGTEVFGDEAVFRRMFLMLLHQGPRAEDLANEVGIRRDGEWIRVSVELGPDTSASSTLERRWLNQVAAKQGGRLELHGSTQTIVLPAEQSNQAQLEELKHELEQAQQLGESYARELAAILSREAEAAPGWAKPGPGDVSLVNNLRAVASALLPTLDRLRASLRDAPGSETSAVLLELIGELKRLAALTTKPPERGVDLAKAIRAAAGELAERAAGREVHLDLDLQATVLLNSDPAVVNALTHGLLTHALEASPRGTHAKIRLRRVEADGAQLFLFESEDGGARVPQESVSSLLNQSVDPATLGRPRGLALLTLNAACQALRSAHQARVRLSETPQGHVLTCVELSAQPSARVLG